MKLHLGVLLIKMKKRLQIFTKRCTEISQQWKTQEQSSKNVISVELASLTTHKYYVLLKLIEIS